MAKPAELPILIAQLSIVMIRYKWRTVCVWLPCTWLSSTTPGGSPASDDSTSLLPYKAVVGSGELTKDIPEREETRGSFDYRDGSMTHASTQAMLRR